MGTRTVSLLADACPNSDYIPNWPTALVVVAVIAALAFVVWVVAR